MLQNWFSLRNLNVAVNPCTSSTQIFRLSTDKYSSFSSLSFHLPPTYPLQMCIIWNTCGFLKVLSLEGNTLAFFSALSRSVSPKFVSVKQHYYIKNTLYKLKYILSFLLQYLQTVIMSICQSQTPTNSFRNGVKQMTFRGLVLLLQRKIFPNKHKALPK